MLEQSEKSNASLQVQLREKTRQFEVYKQGGVRQDWKDEAKILRDNFPSLVGDCNDLAHVAYKGLGKLICKLQEEKRESDKEKVIEMM